MNHVCNCRALDALVAGFCLVHKRARINYDTPDGTREFIWNMAAVAGLDLKVEGKLRQGEPELL